MTQYSKGSQWGKWDLHIHTPDSFQHDYPSWDEFIDSLEKIENVKVLGMTDYFTIEGYKKIIENREKGRLKNIALIVPNIELRLNIFVPKKSSGDKQKRLNLHVILSDQISVEDIETQFLQTLDICIDGTPGGLGDFRKLTKGSIEQLGKNIKQYQPSMVKDSDFFAGCKNITVSLDAVAKALQKSCFQGKYLIVLPTSDWDRISWDGQDYQTRKTLLQTAHAVFCGQGSTINWCQGKGDLSPERFKREFGSLKASLHGSDAHTLDTICKPENNKFCWIKADPTFEGLKQIIYEPELRVKIQEEDPSESEAYAKLGPLYIDFPNDMKIKVEANKKTNFCLRGSYSLEFSNNLTCIIGGRGNGKSTLAHIIYNSWTNHEPNKLSDINSPLINLELGPSSLKELSKYTQIDIPITTEFFFQNEIEQAARSIEAMSTLISKRLNILSSLDGSENIEKIRETWATSFSNIEELIKAFDEITTINNLISRYKENIATLKKQVETIKSENYKSFQSRIKAINSKISEFKTYEKDYNKFIEHIELLTNNILKLKWSETQGSLILNNMRINLIDQKSNLEKTFIDYQSKYHNEHYPEQLKSVQEKMEKYLKDKGLSSENVHELSQANTKINEFDDQIRIANLKKEPYQKIFDGKNQVIQNYQLNYEAYRSRFMGTISSLQTNLSRFPVSEKEITFDLFEDYEPLKNEIVDFVKDTIRGDAKIRSDVIERIIFGEVNLITLIKDKKNIRQHINQSTVAEMHRQIIQELISDDDFLEKLYLRMQKYFYNIDNILIQTKLGGKLLQNTSFGERCGIVVSILLIIGTNPIIIDQPEDHLDGRFISNVLVPLIREQKYNRQIILITRDANIVVGSDAELIHILEAIDDKTYIIPSSLENILNRETYIWILDGGADAFAQREKKYDIGNLIN